MGGCKCTYRNCTVKSDGHTHMFRYPVFERLRCHKWLKNADKLHFLDLKVSQLKNRVVCQNHFKDEYFMNYKKCRLKFDAIPTEDGPYCDSTKYKGNHKDSKRYSIILEDIEDEHINGFEKKNNFSMKYADFLTNCDLVDGEKSDGDNLKNKICDLDVLPIYEKEKLVNLPDDSSYFIKLSLPDKNVKKMQTQPMLIVSPYIDSSNEFKNENLQDNQIVSNIFTFVNEDNKLNITCDLEDKQVTNNELVVKKPKVRIISEKKITEPVVFSGEFKPVSPSFVLNGSQSKKDINNIVKSNSSTNDSPEHSVPIVINLTAIDNENLQQVETLVEPVINIDNTVQSNILSSVTSSPSFIDAKENKNDKIEIHIPPVVKIENTNQSNNIFSVRSNNLNKPTSPKVSLLKSRVAPERVAAIEKKRNFNKKLRDIIESCLDKLENADKPNEEIKLQENLKPMRKLKPTRLQELPVLNPHDYTVSFLGSRMSQMENTLLSKIEQNSKRITELNNSVGKVFSKKNSPIQTKVDEEAHKKLLFQEISKYLSPNTKSLIYEELFINKFSLNESNTPPKPKRRRCR